MLQVGLSRCKELRLKAEFREGLPLLDILRHFPYSPEPEGDRIQEVKGFGAPGELLSLSFSLLSSSEIENLEIYADNLCSASDEIATAINVHVVKVWPQAGIGVYQSTSVDVPELLLKDDREKLTDGYIKGCRHRRHFFRQRCTYYQPPDVRLVGNCRTSLEANRPKQIWLSVKIPPTAKPQTYEGRVHIRCDNAESADTHVTLKLHVLPIKLLPADRDLFIWYKGSLDCSRPRHYVTEDIFRTQLQDIFDHGFRSISLNEYQAVYLKRALRIAEEIGFDGHAVITPPYPRRFPRLKLERLKLLFYVSDEIDMRGPASFDDHIDNSVRAKALSVRTMASLIHHTFTSRLLDDTDVGHAPDVLSYYLPQNVNYFWAHSELPELKNKQLYYYWLSHMEKPNLHRVLAGVFFWKSKAHGIAPYCYQHLPQPPFSPFNDFDEWEPGFHVGEERRAFKDHMTTYPAIGGSIPTVHWKGLSDGISDLRYLTTLDHATNIASASTSENVRGLASVVRSRTDRFLKRIDLKSIQIVSETNSAPYSDVAPIEYQEFREQMARDIIDLQTECATAKEVQPFQMSG